MDFHSSEVREQALAMADWAAGRHTDPQRFSRLGLAAEGHQLRALGVGNDGAMLVPNPFAFGFYKGMDQTNVLRSEATLFEDETGGTLSVPVLDDSEVEAVVIPENAEAASADVQVDAVELTPKSIHSKITRISSELWYDGGAAFQSQTGALLGRRVGRKAGTLFINGTGVDEPLGLVTATTQGMEGAGTELTFDDLVALRYGQLNAAYQAEAKWLMTPETMGEVLKLVCESPRCVFDGTLLMGRPVLLIDAMPAIAAGARPIIFAALRAYAIREVGGVTIRKYTERYAVEDQIGLAAILRTDGKLLDSTASAYLQLAEE